MRGYPEELEPLAGNRCPIRECAGKVSFGYLTDDATRDKQALLVCQESLEHVWGHAGYFLDDSVFGVDTPTRDGRTPTVTGRQP